MCAWKHIACSAATPWTFCGMQGSRRSWRDRINITILYYDRQRATDLHFKAWRITTTNVEGLVTGLLPPSASLLTLTEAVPGRHGSWWFLRVANAFTVKNRVGGGGLFVSLEDGRDMRMRKQMRCISILFCTLYFVNFVLCFVIALRFSSNSASFGESTQLI